MHEGLRSFSKKEKNPEKNSVCSVLMKVIFLSKFDVFSRDPVFICVDTRIELGPLFNSQCYSDTHTIIPAGVYSFRHGIYVYLDGTETKETQGETKDVRYMTNIKGGQTREN